MQESFETYCRSKKIDVKLFESKEKDQFLYLKDYFEQTGEASFTAQKLFLINGLRRRFLLKDSENILDEKPISKPKIAIPKLNVAKSNSEKSPTNIVNDNENLSEAKPKTIFKPIVKPKVVDKPKGSNEVKSDIEIGEKPKVMAKPIMKPKIPKKED